MVAATSTASSPAPKYIAIQPVPIRVENGANRITLYVVPEGSTCFAQQKDESIYDYR